MVEKKGDAGNESVGQDITGRSINISGLWSIGVTGIYCDEKLGEEELLKRLIKVIGDNEYTFKSFSKGKGGRLSLYHKYCGQDISLLLGSFIFRHTKRRKIRL